MKILVFGAGVIGISYAWQVSLAGHDVALLVRPGRKQELERKGIAISCLDNRGGLLFLGGGKKDTTTIYHPVLVEGERLGVKMPYVRGFQEYVERLSTQDTCRRHGDGVRERLQRLMFWGTFWIGRTRGEQHMDQAVWSRWLGVAGIEVRVNEQILALDPFLTRPSLCRMWCGHVHSDSALVATTIPQCDFVLATHAHWDHVIEKDVQHV